VRFRFGDPAAAGRLRTRRRLLLSWMATVHLALLTACNGPAADAPEGPSTASERSALDEHLERESAAMFPRRAGVRYLSCGEAAVLGAERVCLHAEDVVLGHEQIMVCDDVELYPNPALYVLILREVQARLDRGRECADCVVMDVGEGAELSYLDACFQRMHPLTEGRPSLVPEDSVFVAAIDASAPAAVGVRRASYRYRRAGSDRLHGATLE
jgi:hypothetical protein